MPGKKLIAEWWSRKKLRWSRKKLTAEQRHRKKLMAERRRWKKLRERKSAR